MLPFLKPYELSSLRDEDNEPTDKAEVESGRTRAKNVTMKCSIANLILIQRIASFPEYTLPFPVVREGRQSPRLAIVAKSVVVCDPALVLLSDYDPAVK